MSENHPSPLRFSRSEWALVGITIIWGATFLIIQQGLSVSGPLFFVGTRFAFAALLMLLLSAPILKGLTRRELWAGALIGVSIFLGHALQTYGLQTISSSKSAFITALYVPMVPLLQWLVLKRPPPVMRWVGIGFAFSGLVLLAGPKVGAFAFVPGEGATLLGAVVIAAQIILIGKFAGQVDVRRVSLIELAVTAILAFMLMPVTGEPIPEFSWLLLLCTAGLGLATTLIAGVMNWAQQSVTPTRATVIYAAEPIWAGIFGRIAGERLPGLALLGGAFIVAGVIVSELKLKRASKESSDAPVLGG